MKVIVAARLSQDAEGQTGLDTQDEDAQEWAEFASLAVPSRVRFWRNDLKELGLISEDGRILF